MHGVIPIQIARWCIVINLNRYFNFDHSRYPALLDRSRTRPVSNAVSLPNDASKDIIDPSEKTRMIHGGVQSRDAVTPTMQIGRLFSDLMDSKNLRDVFSALHRFLDNVFKKKSAAATSDNAGTSAAAPSSDSRIGAPATSSTAPGTTSTAPVTTSPGATSSSSNSGADINVDGGGPNTIHITNTSDQVQNYGLFTNPTAGMSSSWGVPNGFMTLQPGESANFKVGSQAGYVQQLNDYTQADYDSKTAVSSKNNDNFKASRAEYNFTNFNGTDGVWFNDSNIDGYNAALSMRAGDQVAGSSASILNDVASSNPNLIETVGGQKIIKGAQFFSDAINTEAVDVLDARINNNPNEGDTSKNTTTYVLPDDNAAVRWSASRTLELEFGNA
ncbi:hypothetical protein RCH09_000689 [Actimicrobium sp. GrIS 1.19]|uniref:hypothetical protein n=1 Tax=Actimicrobium sp. GrIS 1.19 TaxID=3071708 RepID=UPI002DFF31B6|nr:hypothetical protein [Actimicrobium sp. GrIS 1.19]